MKRGPLQRWFDRIDWEKRVKAVCKPCWEIKYCPYGVLVEQFPISEKSTEKSCRIYGHDCPVFSVAEAFTETKELRRIDRTIPRSVQFRVLKRENQICQSCGTPVKDEDIEFDHFIPHSKGGSSDEHNVVLLCRRCNRKKGATFEKEYLVDSVLEHTREPHDVELIKMLKSILKFHHDFVRKNRRIPNAHDYTKLTGSRKPDRLERSMVNLAADMRLFFSSNKPEEISQVSFQALKSRWGFIDGRLYKLTVVATNSGVSSDELIRLEGDLVFRLGWHLPRTPANLAKWTSL